MSSASHTSAPAVSALNLERLRHLHDVYKGGLLNDTIPFWLRHGTDNEQGGILCGLDRDGTVIDTDKCSWLQGRAAWTFASLCRAGFEGPEEQWKQMSLSCIRFLRKRCRAENGKLYFTVTREGQPLRMRRYAYAECFAAMGNAVYARLASDERCATDAINYFKRYLSETIEPGSAEPKVNPQTRSMRSISAPMMTLVTAQELRAALRESEVNGRSLSQWADFAIEQIERYFYRPDLGVTLETVAADGSLLNHFDGRTLNPGHAIECAWFIMHEAKIRGNDTHLTGLGLGILDCMWERGWDNEYGGLLSFTDLYDLPVQEYWAHMKFWWPHNETIIATLLAWQLTKDPKYAGWHTQVHDWAHKVFADPEHGEWFGYATREGKITTQLKGNTFKGPFHLPRMQLYCANLTTELLAEQSSGAPR